MQRKLTPDELRPFLRKDNAKALQILLANWAVILASFALVATWPNLVTIALAFVLLGGRQLGLGVIMHDCAHQAFFSSRLLNRWVGQWLCAWPIFADIRIYWDGHAEHHRFTGTARDPDLASYRAYPVSRASLGRKLWRDVSGKTGLKLLISTFTTGVNIFNLSGRGTRRLPWGALGANFALLAGLWFAGHAALYLLWLGSYLTTFMMFARIRQIAEHGHVPDLSGSDPQRNTRTTRARWWERLTVAPNFVNYHAEHHTHPGVPPYHLPALHRYFCEHGFYDDVRIFDGYSQVLRHVSTQT